jgi:hypothetical protein
MAVPAAPPIRIHPWAEAGQAAFARAFPHLAVQIPFADFYVCPVCIKAFNTAAGSQIVTRDHVPPESVGGKRMVLTCYGCNSKVAGSGLDAHASREADVFAFFEGKLRPTKGELSTKSGLLPIRLSMEDHYIKMLGVPKAIDPANQAAVIDDLNWAIDGENWRDFTFNISFQPYSPKRAATSWLRSAYLAYFAAFGYQFIMRPELDPVRAKFADPVDHPLTGFRIIIAPSERAAAPTLLMIEQPTPFRSYAMCYDRNIMFLPRYNDNRLYERLMAQPPGPVKWTGKQIPWPTAGPVFSRDLHTP